ncbi:MAG: hemerythrin domain-containing protein [Omnitrophica WOR_2 bacterium]
MATVTQPLRDEHKELFPQVESLRIAAESVREIGVDRFYPRIEEAYEFLTHHLIPHAQAEDRALYPVVQKVMGAPEATATMSRDHVEVGRLTEDLAKLRHQIAGGQISASQANDLRQVLYGLYALVKVHFAKEEEIYLPLLDARLSKEEASAMFSAMEHAAHEAKEQLTHPR